MKRVLADLILLLAIALPVSGLMLLIPKNKLRIERNWGELLYSPPVSFDEASAVAEVFVQQGIFRGQPISTKLIRDGQLRQLLMVYRRDYARVVPRETLVLAGQQFCRAAFAGKTASVWLADETFTPFEELVPPTQFPPAPATTTASTTP